MLRIRPRHRKTARAAARSLALIASLAAPGIPAASDICDGISPVTGTGLAAIRIASGLATPTFVTGPPNDPSRLMVLEQDGRIRLLKLGVLQPGTFLDISDLVRSPIDGGGSEEGLLGMAFDPAYVTSGHFFLYHTEAGTGDNVLVRYRRLGTNTDVGDPASRVEVLRVPHPDTTAHNGGMLAFGPLDGLLYVATGDGGILCDSTGQSQNPASRRGKILRIDVRTLPYAIPAGNPFAGGDPADDEVWAMGFRNPWRFAFDRATGDLIVGDVGQSEREEIDVELAGTGGGLNYGWPAWEGSLCPGPGCSAPTCSVLSYRAPALEYDHNDGCAVTAGTVYRGCRMPGLHGTFFFSDFCSAWLRSFRLTGGAVADLAEWTPVLDPPSSQGLSRVTSFGEDPRGETLIVNRGAPFGTTGEVWKLAPILPDLEVSAPGAQRFRIDPNGWTWEDLQRTTSHPIAEYRVYRSEGRGNGTFACVHRGVSPSWTPGDPAIPPAKGVFTYIVTAINGAGDETSPGTGSDGTPRALSPAPCPP